MTPLYPQKLALTSPTGGGRSVGIVRSRTKATEFSLVLPQIRMLSYTFWTFLMRTIIWKARGLQESAQCTVIWITQQYKAPECFAHNKYGMLHMTRVNSCVATL